MGPGSATDGTGLVVSSSVQNIRNSLASFVRNFPCECHRHVIVITFILRNKHHSNIQIEIEELEGGVRTTGLFCLLGIGIGLGSLFVYKLYTRLFPKTLLPPPVSTKPSRPNSGCRHLVAGSGARQATDKTLAETPDSGISAYTVAIHNDASHFRTGAPSNPGAHSIRQNVRDAVHLHRRQTTVADWLACTELHERTDLNFDTEDFSSDGNQRNHLTKPLHSRRSSGYLSTDPAHGEGDGGELRAIRKHSYEQDPVCFTLDEDFAYDEVLSITDHVLVPSILSESPEDDLSAYEVGSNLGFAGYEIEQEWRTIGKRSASPCRQRRLSAGNLLAPDVPRLWLRRNQLSCSSDLSSGSSGCTCRESLVSKGFSVDLGEDLAGMMTPPDGETGGLNHWTMSSMDQLHRELKDIQKDIDRMTEKVFHLSKEDSVKLSVAVSSVDENNGMSRRGSKSRERSQSLSPARTHRCSVDRNIEVDVDSPDFIWDYHSDLALNKCDEPLFVVKRPHHVLCDDVQNQHLARSLESETVSDGAQSDGVLASKQRHSSLQDLFSFEDLGESFEDEVIFSNRLVKSSSPVDKNMCSKSEDRRSSSSSPAHDRASRSNQGLVCDHIASIRAFGFSGHFCGQVGHSQVSSNAYCTCHKQVVFVRPHNPCPSCHGHRRERAMSARTWQKSGQPLPSGREITGRFTSDESSSSCRSPPVNCHRFINVPVVQCQSLSGSAIQNRQSSDFCTDNCTKTCTLKPWLPVPETHFCDVINSARASAIGNKVNLKDYLAEEFSCFDQRQGIKKGYDLLHRLWGVTGIRRLYNDNYSCLRAVLYQALMSNLTKLNKIGNFQCSVQKLAMIIDSGHPYLVNWSFGSVSLLPKEEVVMKMTDCLHNLFEQAAAVCEMSSVTCREQYLLALLNHSPEMDQSLLEALKILMMLKAIELFDDYRSGQKNVLSFVLQLFAKESSNSLESFFNNHINMIGNTAPMKAVEMCLLGLTLDVRIEVMRPYCFNREGFVVHFPDEGADEFHKVQIIEEEQNYFCIPTMKYLS